MKISNNILKYHLKNVYFITGTACGGKTTISKLLAEKYDFYLYDENRFYDEHRHIAHKSYQTAMTEKFSSWEQYFNRDYREYSNWLRDLAEEELEMIIIDLIKLSQNQQVIVDIHLDPGLAKLVTDYKRVVFLVAPPDKVLRDYYDRDGHREIYECIMRLDNPKKALENVNKMLKYTTEKILKSIYDSGLYYHIRNDRISKEARLSLVEQHFELNKKNISICRKKTTL